VGASGLQLHSHSQTQNPYTQEIAVTNYCAISLVVSRFRFVVATLVALVTFSVSFVPGQRVGMMKKGRVVKKTMKHVTHAKRKHGCRMI